MSSESVLDIELRSAEQVSQAQIYLRAMAVAVEGVGHFASPEDRRSHWESYCEIQGKLHVLIPPIGDTPARGTVHARVLNRDWVPRPGASPKSLAPGPGGSSIGAPTG